jgi:hypothetical protein
MTVHFFGGSPKKIDAQGLRKETDARRFGEKPLLMVIN